MNEFALSLDGVITVDGERVDDYKWVPISRGQSFRGIITATEASYAQAGQVRTFYPLEEQPVNLIATDHMTWRSMSQKEKNAQNPPSP